MAIVLDAVSSGGQSYGAPTLTIAHTISGTNCALLVFAGNNGNSEGLTSITYNGVAMTRVVISPFNGQAASVYAYILANPALGLHDIVVTPIATTAGFQVVGVSYTGVDQTTPTDFSASGSAPSQASPRSDTITVSAGGIAVDVIGSDGGAVADPFVLGGSQTQVIQFATGATRIAVSSLAAATSMSWSWVGGTHQIGHAVVALKAAGAAGTSPGAPTIGTATAGNASASILFTAGTAGSTATTGYTATSTPGGFTGTRADAAGPIVVSGLTNGTSYTFTVYQTNSAGNSPNSAASNAVVPAAVLGIITTPVMKNNTGTVLASEAGVVVNVYSATTGALAVRKTAQASSASGIVTITDALIVTGTSYAYEVVLSANGRRLPLATAT